MHSTRSLLADDDVLGDLIAWRDGGLRTVLVTLVAIDGATPRPLGAQMAVAQDGRYSGYLSGGCMEQAVVQESLRTLTERNNRLVRYGKGSAYFDLKLPCGSGLDLYFDQDTSQSALRAAAAYRSERVAFVLSTDLDSGISQVSAPGEGTGTRLDGQTFHRLHVPLPRVVLVGGGPAMIAIARLVSAAGLELEIHTPDETARVDLAASGLPARMLEVPSNAGLDRLDLWTAAIVAFHDHDWEAPVLAEILRSSAYYVGVMGSRKAHQDRLARLTALGVPPDAQARLRSPIGMIPGAKSRATLGVGILAELMAEAKAAGMIA